MKTLRVNELVSFQKIDLYKGDIDAVTLDKKTGKYVLQFSSGNTTIRFFADSVCQAFSVQNIIENLLTKAVVGHNRVPVIIHFQYVHKYSKIPKEWSGTEEYPEMVEEHSETEKSAETEELEFYGPMYVANIIIVNGRIFNGADLI